MTSTASIELGNHAATRSPATTPSCTSADAIAPTRNAKSSHVRLLRRPLSSMATRASPPPCVVPLFRKKFSTMLSCASGKNLAVEIGAVALFETNTRSPLCPMKPHSSHTCDQNSLGCSIDHEYKSSAFLTFFANLFIRDLATRSSVGVHRALAKSDIGTNLMKSL